MCKKEGSQGSCQAIDAYRACRGVKIGFPGYDGYAESQTETVTETDSKKWEYLRLSLRVKQIGNWTNW